MLSFKSKRSEGLDDISDSGAGIGKKRGKRREIRGG